MTFQEALDFANNIYLRHRREFEPENGKKTFAEQQKIEKNRRTAFYDSLHAERQWDRRHKSP